MKIYHGTRLYAVYSQDVGTFGGRATKATLKIYDGSNYATPRTTISGIMATNVLEVLSALKRREISARTEINDYLRTFLPSNDPYRLVEQR